MKAYATTGEAGELLSGDINVHELKTEGLGSIAGRETSFVMPKNLHSTRLETLMGENRHVTSYNRLAFWICSNVKGVDGKTACDYGRVRQVPCIRLRGMDYWEDNDGVHIRKMRRADG
jgi:hypothetical protein